MPSRLRLWHLCVLCCLLPVLPARAAQDVRILIDTSGSMKQTDPQNLRIPALKLLAHLMPAGAHSGVWLFDQAPEVLLPVAVVDAGWKQRARLGAARIHSRGLYTNIEAALEAATADWLKQPPTDERHVILLTDGKVDVSKDPAASVASRERLLRDLLPRLKAGQAHLHTIALSDDVDEDLLKQLAGTTGGWSEAAKSSAALQRAFLHVFEQAAPPNALPLRDNGFTVDSSVHEVTLLVFRPANGPALSLTSPRGTTYTATGHATEVRWQSEPGYDLITLPQPEAGSWKFSGPADPDNRALVITDLELGLNEVPPRLMPGENLTLNARLLEKGTPIERDDFLHLVSTSAALSGEQGAGDLVTLVLDQKTRQFTGTTTARLAAGRYELVVRAKSSTFEREQRRRLEVAGEPLKVSADITPARTAEAGSSVKVLLEFDDTALDPAGISGYVLLEGPDGRRDAQPITGGGARQTVEFQHVAGGESRLSVLAQAAGRDGRLLRLNPPEQTVKVPAPPPPPAPKVTPPPPPPTVNALRVTLIVLGGNAGLALLLGPLWYLLRRREIPSRGVSL